MFWKLKKTRTVSEEQSEQASEQIRRDRMRLEYVNALRQIDVFLSQAKNDEIRAAILDYAIKVVKRDLIGEGLAQLVYGKEIPEWRGAFPLTPPIGERKIIQIDLSSTDVLVTPWNVNRLPGAIFDLLYEPFDRHRSNYTANYYPEIDLVIINNGIHHTAVASVGNGGIIDCYECLLTPSFEHFSTDGAYWNSLESAVWTNVVDFRFALIYTLAKMRYELSEGQPDADDS